VAFTYALVSTSPAGTDLVSLGDDNIRDFKAGMLERINSRFVDANTDPWIVKSPAGGTGNVQSLVSTADNSYSLGTAGLRFSDFRTVLATFSGLATFTSGLTVSSGATTLQALFATTGSFSGQQIIFSSAPTSVVQILLGNSSVFGTVGSVFSSGAPVLSYNSSQTLNTNAWNRSLAGLDSYALVVGGGAALEILRSPAGTANGTAASYFTQTPFSLSSVGTLTLLGSLTATNSTFDAPGHTAGITLKNSGTRFAVITDSQATLGDGLTNLVCFADLGNSIIFVPNGTGSAKMILSTSGNLTISNGGLTVVAGTSVLQALTATTGAFSSDVTLENGKSLYLRRASGNAQVAGLRYDTGTDDLSVVLGGSILRWRDTGIGVPMSLTASGLLTVADRAAITGAITISLGVNALLGASRIIIQQETSSIARLYTCGPDGVTHSSFEFYTATSGAVDPKILTLSNGAVAVTGSLSVNNGLTVTSGGIVISGSSSFANNIILTGGSTFLPGSDNTGTVGSATFRFAEVRAVTVYGAVVGNADTATKLATARLINGVSFDGTADITVTAAAGTLSGATLAAGVTGSSLTSVGILAAPHMTAPVVNSGGLTITAGGLTVTAGGAAITGNSTITGSLDKVTGLKIVGSAFGAGAAGELILGNTTAAGANAGGAGLPAGPVAFLSWFLAGTIIKIPYYAN
jgi:hypothetical protein